MAEGLVLLIEVGRTHRDYSRLCRSPRWGRRRFALAICRA